MSTTNTTNTTTAAAGQGVRRPYPVCPFACELEDAAQLRASAPDAPTTLGACACPDDRCAGYHHEVGEPCPCADALAAWASDAPAAATPPACPEWCVLPEGHPYTLTDDVDASRTHTAAFVAGPVVPGAHRPAWTVEAYRIETRTASGVVTLGPVGVSVQVADELDAAGALALAAAVKRAADAAQAITGTSGGAWGAPAVVSVGGGR